MTENTSFACDRMSVVREFAQTMIVIDDEASQQEFEIKEMPVAGLEKPDRRMAKTAGARQEAVAKKDAKHALDAKTLIDSAMELGLVCSVLRPTKGENVRARVRKAAERVDIVCLDWEIYDDNGETAKTLIKDIVASDEGRSGRLRLIGIYTGDRDRQNILNEILNSFSENDRERLGIKKHGGEGIISASGLRIVYLFKAHGTQLNEDQMQWQVSETDLPNRLLEEFANLSQGLLSNVALATIASIRGVAHHVVGKFGADMDGPYFHHRATIPMPNDAEHYAVNIVLSELKGIAAADLVGRRFAGPTAIANRIRDIAGENETLTFVYENEGKEEHTEISVENVIELVVDGYDQAGFGEKPTRKKFSQFATSLFGSDVKAAKASMNKFAALTEIRRHPGDYAGKSDEHSPLLGLGSIVQDKNKKYWICLQASCDSVRLEKDRAFLFAPLTESGAKPEHVVPVQQTSGRIEYVALELENMAYANTMSVVFPPDPEIKAVKAIKIKGKHGVFFESVDEMWFLWIADLKHRRSLRIAQRLGQQMGRLGFDEFEPYRRGEL